MAKKKIVVSNATIVNKDGELYINGTVKDEPVEYNIDKELKDFIGEDSIEFKVVKKTSKTRETKPSYTYECGCNIKLKSKIDNLKIQCLNCQSEFEIAD